MPALGFFCLSLPCLKSFLPLVSPASRLPCLTSSLPKVRLLFVYYVFFVFSILVTSSSSFYFGLCPMSFVHFIVHLIPTPNLSSVPLSTSSYTILHTSIKTTFYTLLLPSRLLPMPNNSLISLFVIATFVLRSISLLSPRYNHICLL